MNSLFILLLSIWNMFLFYNDQYGLSVILFIVPLLYFIYYYLKKYKLLKNRRCLLLMIPIVLLSLTYLFFNNEFFYYLNQFVIPILILLMFVLTLHPNFNLKNIVTDICNLLVEPFRKFSLVIKKFKEDISEKLHINDNVLKNLVSILVVIPIVAIILMLLTSSDMEFNNLVGNILKMPRDFFESFDINNFIWKVFSSALFFLYFSATLYYLSGNFITKKPYISKTKNNDNKTIFILMIVLNVIYFVFDIIQIKSLMFHYVGLNINYSEYAREGFFQLMLVSLINMIIVLKANKTDDRTILINVLSIIMVIFTFVIIISSILRMNLYESMYGYTLLRLLVYITLFTEIILIIPLILYIINNKFNITKSFIIIIITVYTAINFINIDSIIAKRNIQRYFDNKDIDIEYLENYHTDNVRDLIVLYENTNDYNLKQSLYNYLDKSIDTSYDLQGFNISKYIAKREISKINN